MGLLVLFAVAALFIVVVGTLVLVRRMVRPNRKSYAFAIARKLPVDPAEFQLAAEETMLRYDDGTSAPGWLVQGRQADGPVIIITHGWANSRFGSLIKLPFYASFASMIVIYDVRGHGDSTAATTTLGVREADDLLALLDQVNREGRPVVLVGSSMGSVATLRAAAMLSRDDAPHRLVGVIVDGPYLKEAEPVAAHLRRDRLPAQPFTWLADRVLRLTLPGYGCYDAAAMAAKLTCPLLVLHGSEDPICSVASGRRIAEAARDGRLVEFPGAGHGRLWLHDEARYQNAVAAFMARLAGSGDGTDPPLATPSA